MKTKITSMLVLFLVMTSTQTQADLIWDDGHYVFDEGYESEIFMYNDATADIIGGGIGAILCYDASSVNVFENSNISLIKPLDSSSANIYGGEINHLFSVGLSEIKIYGGYIINGIDPDNSSIVYLYVEENYEFDPTGGTREGGIITGKWLMSGDSFSISLDDFGDINHIIFIPEPCSLILLTIGWFVSRKRKSIR